MSVKDTDMTEEIKKPGEEIPKNGGTILNPEESLPQSKNSQVELPISKSADKEALPEASNGDIQKPQEDKDEQKEQPLAETEGINQDKPPKTDKVIPEDAKEENSIKPEDLEAEKENGPSRKLSKESLEETSGRKKSQRIREKKRTKKGQQYFEQMREKNIRKKNKQINAAYSQALKESRLATLLGKKEKSKTKPSPVTKPRKSLRQSLLRANQEAEKPNGNEKPIVKKKRGRKPKYAREEEKSSEEVSKNSPILSSVSHSKKNGGEEKNQSSKSMPCSKQSLVQFSNPESNIEEPKPRRTKMLNAGEDFPQRLMNDEAFLPRNEPPPPKFYNQEPPMMSEQFNKREKKYYEKQYEPFPETFPPQYENSPQYSFQGPIPNLKMLPFVFHFDSLNFQLMGDKEMQYLNEHKQMERQLNKFNQMFSHTPGVSVMPTFPGKDDYYYMMVKMKRDEQPPFPQQFYPPKPYLYQDEDRFEPDAKHFRNHRGQINGTFNPYDRLPGIYPGNSGPQEMNGGSRGMPQDHYRRMSDPYRNGGF